MKLFMYCPFTQIMMSPSMRREWIEIAILSCVQRSKYLSPSMRREWIEIQIIKKRDSVTVVSLHAEGVD